MQKILFQSERPLLRIGSITFLTGLAIFIISSAFHAGKEDPELLYTLFDCKDSAEVMSKGYENALLLITKTMDKVMTGEVQLQDLVVSKYLRQDLAKYRSLFPHVAAAIQLGKSGKSSVRGDSIQYVYTDAHHSNPLCRVTAPELVKQAQELNYDKEKYREMLLEAAETALGYFGFDSTFYYKNNEEEK